MGLKFEAAPCADNFRERFSSVSAGTIDRENDSSVVWRSRRRLDGLSAFFPIAASTRLSLRPSTDAAVCAAGAGLASRGSACRQRARIANPAESILEAAGARAPGAAHFVGFDADRGIAFLSALRDEPALASLVGERAEG